MRRRYTDEQRAQALAALKANGGNVLHTAQVLKIPRKTLDRWQREPLPELAELRQKKETDLTALLEAELRSVLALMPAKRSDATYSQLATAMGILTDKIQLLTGKPTSNGVMTLEVRGVDYRQHLAPVAPDESE